jgi:hypothetical protein
MALKKQITLPNGTAGEYIRIDYFEFNRRARTAYVQLALFLSEAQARAYPDYPMQVVGQLELTGAKFDQYLSGATLAADGGNLIAQLYEAAKVEPLRAVNGIVVIDIGTAEDV